VYWRGFATTAISVRRRREETAMASDFIVLSHREPYREVQTDDGDTVLQRKTNGVFTTLDSVMRQKHGTWIAWREHEEGDAFVPRVQVPAPGHEDAYTVRRIPLTPDEARRFYYDFTSTAHALRQKRGKRISASTTSSLTPRARKPRLVHSSG
ncbi:MAG: hypothetical protein ACREKM_00925, partial [Longimicrobiales bacterium]